MKEGQSARWGGTEVEDGAQICHQHMAIYSIEALLSGHGGTCHRSGQIFQENDHFLGLLLALLLDSGQEIRWDPQLITGP